MASDIENLLTEELTQQRRLQERYKKLEAELENLDRELTLSEGKVMAYRGLLGLSDSNDSSSDSNGEDYLDKNNQNALKTKGRAPRATKKEMEQRRQACKEIFFEEGDISVKELQPFLEEKLGITLAAHQPRAILMKYPDDFRSLEEHGLWGLTEAAKAEMDKIQEELEQSE